eukprot:SAG11_NODE_968_length_6354_cov_16.546922_2_plen_116_part_00
MSAIKCGFWKLDWGAVPFDPEAHAVDLSGAGFTPSISPAQCSLLAVATAGEYRDDVPYIKLCAARIAMLQEICFDCGVNFYVGASSSQARRKYCNPLHPTFCSCSLGVSCMLPPA